MKLARTSLFLGFVAFGAVGANAVWYTDEATFLVDLDPVFYLEDFSSFQYGDPLAGDASWVAPGGNGYGFTASAPNGLWSNDSALSTLQNVDPLTLDLTGKPATAFAGIFANSDIGGNHVAGTTTVTLSTGDEMSVDNADNGTVFLGWIGDSTLTHVSVLSTDWAEIDHTYVGAKAQSVPEPFSMALLAAGAASLVRRRRT